MQTSHRRRQLGFEHQVSIGGTASAPAHRRGDARAWLQQVPDQFTFTLKAPKRITHVNRLHDSESNVAEFLRRASALGSKLGVILFQLPPYLKKDLPRLAAFLDQLPPGRPIAFEFRSSSWQDDEVYKLLRSRAAILCVTDTDEGDTPFIGDCSCMTMQTTCRERPDLVSGVASFAAVRVGIVPHAATVADGKRSCSPESIGGGALQQHGGSQPARRCALDCPSPEAAARNLRRRGAPPATHRTKRRRP